MWLSCIIDKNVLAQNPSQNVRQKLLKNMCKMFALFFGSSFCGYFPDPKAIFSSCPGSCLPVYVLLHIRLLLSSFLGSLYVSLPSRGFLAAKPVLPLPSYVVCLSCLITSVSNYFVYITRNA